MILEGWADREELEERHSAVRKEVDDALAWAEASPLPDPATLLDDVYENQ
jgi:pyruvate dehydrogenase E1 component alpha subunit